MKRRGIARLIPWLIGLDVLLLTVLLLVNVLHFRIDTDDGSPLLPISPSHSDQQPVAEISTEPFVMGDEPEQLLIDNSDLGRPVETTVPVDDEEHSLTLVAGSFALRGGPDFSLYLDQSVFQLIENAGRCYFAPQSDASNLYLEIAYFSGVTADALAASVFQDYGIIIQKDAVEDTEFSGQSAKHVQAKTMENQLEAYVLDTDGGSVTLILCTPGKGSGKTQTLLTDSMHSFALAER